MDKIFCGCLVLSSVLLARRGQFLSCVPLAPPEDAGIKFRELEERVK